MILLRIAPLTQHSGRMVCAALAFCQSVDPGWCSGLSSGPGAFGTGRLKATWSATRGSCPRPSSAFCPVGGGCHCGRGPGPVAPAAAGGDMAHPVEPGWVNRSAG